MCFHTKVRRESSLVSKPKNLIEIRFLRHGAGAGDHGRGRVGRAYTKIKSLSHSMASESFVLKIVRGT